MTDFEKTVLQEISALRRAVESLRSDFTINQITMFENLPNDAVVGSDYVAYRFGCSESAVVRGRFDTDKIPRFRQKPLAFIKRNVDAIFRQLNQPITETAAEYRYKIKNGTKRRKN